LIRTRPGEPRPDLVNVVTEPDAGIGGDGNAARRHLGPTWAREDPANVLNRGVRPVDLVIATFGVLPGLSVRVLCL